MADDQRKGPEFEVWEQEFWRHRPLTRMSDGAIVGCQCMDRVFVTKAEDWGTHLADVMTALVRDRDNETARLRGALEQALGWIATAGNTPDWVRLEKAEDIIDAALRVPQTAGDGS